MKIPRCAFGEPLWTGAHPKCAKESARLRQQFDRDVFFGKFNRRGYTLAEWTKAGRKVDDWADAPEMRA